MVSLMLVYLTINLSTVQENKIKTGDVHKHITFRSFKKYTVDAYKDDLKKVNFPNCELFNDINEAYLNFFQKVRIVVDSIAPCKTKRVKANTRKWFDGEILENINTKKLRINTLRNLDFILIKSCTKKQNTIH